LSFDQPDRRYFGDILEAIELIEQFTFGLDFESFRENPMVIAAVERKLQIVSEAAVRLGERAERLCPDQRWSEIRGFGNHLRHAYDKVALDIIRGAVTLDMPSLKASVERALSR
jgi:uncharacterized protein with HEPN domain